MEYFRIFRHFYDFLQVFTSILASKVRYCPMVPKAEERGFVPVILLIVVVALGFVVVGGAIIVQETTDRPLLGFDIENISKESLVNLDRYKLNGAVVEGDLIGTVILPDGSYSAFELVLGKVDRSEENPLFARFVGEVKLRFLSGDYTIGRADNVIDPFYLRDGTKTTGVISDHLSVFLKLKNGLILPVKILKGNVREGILSGVVEAQTYTTGHLIVAEFEGGRLIASTITQNAEKASEADTIISQSALEFYKQIETVKEADILGASTPS